LKTSLQNCGKNCCSKITLNTQIVHELAGKKNLSKCGDCEKAFKEEQGLKELFMRGKESIGWLTPQQCFAVI